MNIHINRRVTPQPQFYSFHSFYAAAVPALASECDPHRHPTSDMDWARCGSALCSPGLQAAVQQTPPPGRRAQDYPCPLGHTGPSEHPDPDTSSPPAITPQCSLKLTH